MGKRLDRAKLTADIEAYFLECDATRERVQLKNGGFVIRQVPYTCAGLASSLGMPVALLHALASGREGARTGAVVSAALLRVERYLLERALMGELQYSASAMLLREFGYGAEAAEAEKESGSGHIVLLGDQAGWSQ